jgi:hypothetical protein
LAAALKFINPPVVVANGYFQGFNALIAPLDFTTVATGIENKGGDVGDEGQDDEK